MSSWEWILSIHTLPSTLHSSTGIVQPECTCHVVQERDPRAYQIFLQMSDGSTFLGSTPEQLYIRSGRAVATEAVAATRPRGAAGMPLCPQPVSVAYERMLHCCTDHDIDRRYAVRTVKNGTLCVACHSVSMHCMLQ